MRFFIYSEQSTVGGQVFIEQFIDKAENSTILIDKWENDFKDYTKIGSRMYDIGVSVVELVRVKQITSKEYNTLKECGIQEA